MTKPNAKLRFCMAASYQFFSLGRAKARERRSPVLTEKPERCLFTIGKSPKRRSPDVLTTKMLYCPPLF